MLRWLQQARIGKKSTLVLDYSEKPLPFNTKCLTYLHWRLCCVRIQDEWGKASWRRWYLSYIFEVEWAKERAEGHSRWQGHQEEKHGGENEWGVQGCHKHLDFAAVCSESKQEIEIEVWQSFLSYADCAIRSITAVIWGILMKAIFWLSMLMELQIQNNG